MTGVRELLREGVALPSADVDVADVMRTARGRRRRRRGILAAFGVVVLALASFGLVRANDGGGGPARVAIGPRQTTDVPDGWTPIAVDPGIRLAVPPGWGSYDFGVTPVATKRVSVGTSAPEDTSVMTACTTPGGQTPVHVGTWLSLWEYPRTSTELALPGGDVLGGSAIVDRPADFRDAPPTDRTCEHVGDAHGVDLAASFEFFAFRDSGRLFVARVVVADPGGLGAPDLEASPRLALAREVLNTLRIAPLETATTATSTSTPAPSTTVPATTSAPAFVPTTTDEQQITELFQAWPQAQSDDEILATFEDGASILDAMHQGLAQRTPEDLAKYSGQVDSVQVTDPNHAIVEYTLLFDGQAQFGRRTGGAVKVDGAWRVSRDTECALLALGAITCPPRSSP